MMYLNFICVHLKSLCILLLLWINLIFRFFIVFFFVFAKEGKILKICIFYFSKRNLNTESLYLPNLSEKNCPWQPLNTVVHMQEGLL